MSEPAKPLPPKKLERSEIIQALLDLPGRRSYLEIGVNRAQTFQTVRAERKVGVDPVFLFDVDKARAEDAAATFHAVTSDVFFGEIASRDDLFDVIFIDGLHTFDQTLRDFCSAIGRLKHGGAIIIDDVMPHDYEGSMRTPEMAIAARKHRDRKNSNGAWMGDVYRLVFFIESYFPQWSFAAVAPRGDQLVVWRAPRPKAVRRRVEAIAQLPYEETIFSIGAYNIQPLDRIVQAVRKSGAAPRLVPERGTSVTEA